MRVLLTGAGGQLGRELQLTCPTGITLRAFDHQALDITDRNSVEAVVADLEPDVIVNTAAYTAVDRAEAESALATAVNVQGVRNLVGALSGHGRMIHLSTDFVFGGASNRPYAPVAPPDPTSVYGTSKLEGERHVLAGANRRGVVIRTAWLYSRFGRNFVKTMLGLMATRDEIEVVADQVGSPTWAHGLANAVWAAAGLPELGGILHWTDAGVASWYDFAIAVQDEAEDLGLLDRSCVIRPIASRDYPTAAQRPAFSVLETEETCRALAIEPVHWRRQLHLMLQQLAELGGP